MPKEFCEISASSWFYYKDICYDVRSHERKKCKIVSVSAMKARAVLGTV